MIPRQFKVLFCGFSLIIFLQCFGYAQLYPPADSVIKYSKPWCRKISRVNYKLLDKISYLPGYFTSERYAQCISIATCKTKKGKTQVAFLWKQLRNLSWYKELWMKGGFTEMIADDYNGDKYTEIVVTIKTSTDFKTQRDKGIYSLRGGREVLIFSWQDFDYTRINYIQKNLKPGDIVSSNHKVTFAQLNNDGIPDISDIITEKKLIPSCCEHHFEYEIQTTEKKYLYLDGSYVESP
jgi:hypothetical protein